LQTHHIRFASLSQRSSTGNRPLMTLHVGVALADGCGDPAAVKNDDGKYFDKNGNPTFNIAPDGTVDWYPYSGYRRYNSECGVCHGPDGAGSNSPQRSSIP
jgi:mono/diheme cytochrome c family protein